MVVILKICAVGITGLIIISIIKAYKPEFTVEPVLCTSIILLWFALEGLQQAIEDHWFADYEWCIGNELDTCNVDAEVADVIIQLALFGDIIYG